MQNHASPNSTAAPNAADIKLRRAGPTDVAAVREVTRAAYTRWVPVIGREPRPMVADHDKAVRQHLIDLLTVDNEPAGLIEMVPAADHLLVENVAVLPTLQGRGHGRRLLAHAEAVAASLGVPELRLYTNKAFAENVQLYLRVGYQVDREEPFMNGVAVHMSKRAPSMAELAVQGQLDAYNAHDIDAFMQWWAEDCRYYAFPDQILASGAAAVRERHVARFLEPNLHGRLVKRIAIANVVVDQETVTRTFPDGPGEVDVVAIYEVEGSKITKAWFKMGPPRLHAADA